LSFSLNPFEPLVFHDEESDLGHGLCEDVASVVVDGVVPGDGRSSSHGDWLIFIDFLDHLSVDVLDLRGALYDLSVSSEVETIRDHVGTVASPAVVDPSLVPFVVGRLVQRRVVQPSGAWAVRVERVLLSSLRTVQRIAL
jgi:hypothetical protein